MAEPQRISPQETRQDMDNNHALLVCAYEGQEKFESNHLEGAVPWEQFQSQLNSIPQDRELIFYCD